LSRALGRASVSPLHQSPRLGAGLLWRSLGRSLRANAVCVRLGLRLGLGGGSPSRSVHFSTINNIRKVLALYEVKCPLCRLRQKIPHWTAVCRASCVYSLKTDENGYYHLLQNFRIEKIQKIFE